MQKGTKAFAKQVGLETINIATRFAQTTQTVLENVDRIVSSERSVMAAQDKRRRKSQRTRKAGRGTTYFLNKNKGVKNKMAIQPKGYQEGFHQAYESLSRGLQTAIHGMVVVPREDFQTYGTATAVKSALQSVPSAMLKTGIGGAEGVSKILLGVQNSVDPQIKDEMQDKYKDH